MIVVLATIELHPGKRANFLAEFHQIVPKVRAEAGCLEYFPAIDTVSAAAARLPDVREAGRRLTREEAVALALR